MRIKAVTLIVLATVLALAGCSSSDNTLASSSQGQLTVNIHDQANPTIDQALVTVSAIQAVDTEGTAFPVDGSALGTEFDLAQLVGASNALTLAADSLPAGTYTRIDVTIASITLVLSDGSQIDPLNGMASITAQIPVSFVVEENMETVIDIHVPLIAFQQNGQVWTFDLGAVSAS